MFTKSDTIFGLANILIYSRDSYQEGCSFHSPVYNRNPYQAHRKTDDMLLDYSWIGLKLGQAAVRQMGVGGTILLLCGASLLYVHLMSNG